MIKTNIYRNLEWVYLESPTSEEITKIIEKYNLNPLIGEKIISPSRKPKVDVFGNHLYLALQIPIRARNNNGKYEVTEKEVDFVIGNRFVITASEQIVEPLHNFSKILETNTVLDKSGGEDHAGILFYYIVKKIYDHMRNDLENIKDALNEAEDHVFLGHERRMVEVLSELSRELIDFKQTSGLHKETLESFKNIPKDFFGNDFSHITEDLRIEYASIHDIVSSNRELLYDLRDTNDSLLSAKQNENMKLFSILAFVTFPLALFLDLFALPTSHVPLIGYKYDWEILAGIVVISAISMFYFFKRKGWL